MPLGTGYTVEEQITGQAERGGLQIQVYPMRPEIYENEIKTKVLRAYELCCSSHRRYSSDPGPIARPHGCARSCPSKSYDLAPIGSRSTSGHGCRCSSSYLEPIARDRRLSR